MKSNFTMFARFFFWLRDRKFRTTKNYWGDPVKYKFWIAQFANWMIWHLPKWALWNRETRKFEM